MALHLHYIAPYRQLLRAAEENNIRDLIIIHTQEPFLLHGYSWFREENPLHVACKYGSLQFVKEVIKINPKLARKTCQNGFTPLHVASANGQVEIVETLAEFDQKLCLVEDLNTKRIPLHVAAMEGYNNVARALILACPESLKRLTPRRETALHLALKNRHCLTFRVLMEEIKKSKFQELLNNKDNEGNTILHIAVSQKLLEEISTEQILELLLSSNWANGIRMDINSVNGRGYTPLDAYYETLNDTVAREMRRILVEAGAKERRFLQNNIRHGQQHRISLSESNLSLMVFVMIATLTFTAVCSPPNFYKNEIPQKNSPLHILDMLFHRGSGYGTNYFYFMVFNVAGFMTSMGAILILTWQHFFGNVLVLASVAVGIVFISLVEKSMPHFHVMVGSSEISVAMCVWVSALLFIGCGVMILLLVSPLLAVSTDGSQRRNGRLQIHGN